MEIYGGFTVSALIGISLAVAAIVLTEIFVRKMDKDD
jgi:uncharacterized membrane protein (DUF485 family)